MSWEAWGDDGAGDCDHLIDAGWWPSEKAKEVEDAIKALMAEPIYEGGKKENGISARFLMRLTVLQDTAELCDTDAKRLLAAEAHAFFKGTTNEDSLLAGPEFTADERQRLASHLMSVSEPADR